MVDTSGLGMAITNVGVWCKSTLSLSEFHDRLSLSLQVCKARSLSPAWSIVRQSRFAPMFAVDTSQLKHDYTSADVGDTDK